MIEQVTNLAERVATNISLSRRGFLGRLGQGALAAAGVLAGVLALPKNALAAGVVCCQYQCQGYRKKPYHEAGCYTAGTPCPDPFFACSSGLGGTLTKQFTASTCKDCYRQWG